MSVLLLCFLSVTFAFPAIAAAADQHKQQAAQFEKMLDNQASAAGADAAKKDIERARQWLESANVLLAKGNEEAASKYLGRVKVSLDLIAAQVQAGNIQKAADDQEEAYYKAKETQIPELEADIQKLQEQKKELQQELTKLR
jgi:wobble nucleotide-excising tRNase